MWQKGQSGNPGGRIRNMGELEKLARSYTVDAINALHEICIDANQSAAARVSAASAILDRGYGKPRQDVEHNHHLPAARATDADLWAILASGGGAASPPAPDTDKPGGVVH